jgi:phosphatidylserine/phosphatidylglycerophosphate/cardiolipin synthase-like enzyme
MTEAAIMLVRGARESIFWGCHGIRPPRIIAETLAEARNRGVDVLLITNSRHASKGLMLWGLLGWMYFESNWHFRWLLELGIRIYEWQRKGPFHSKNLVIDGQVASVGSYNVARASSFHHTESSVVIFGGPVTRAIREQFDADMQPDLCKEITMSDIPSSSGFWRWMASWLKWRAPMERPLHARNRLLPRTLRTDAINAYLDAPENELVSDPAEKGCRP